MKKKIICLALAAMCVMSGCAGKDDKKIVATVGDYNVTMSEFEFFLNNVKQQMEGTEFSTDEEWLTKDINGKKAIEVAKEQALSSVESNVANVLIYKNMGFSYSDEDKNEIQQTKDSIIKQYDANGGYEEFLKEQGISDDFIQMMCESMFCYNKLWEEYSKTAAEVTDEDINTYYDEHSAEFSGYRRAKHVLILTKDADTNEEYSEEKKAEAKEKADEIYKKAQNGADFDKLVEENSEDPGSHSQPDGYTFTDGEMVQEFQMCVDSLAIDEIGFCETSYGYHIIKRLELDKTYFNDMIKQKLQTAAFNSYLDQKMEEFGISVKETEDISALIGAK